MNKITKEELKNYVSEVGECEKEHRKYSSFYITVTHTMKQEDIDELAKEDTDASDFLDVQVTMYGTWDESWGTEWDGLVEFVKVETYQELVPERVIPAHYVTKFKSTDFKPIWE